MGGDIAAWCAYKGFIVTLQDRSAELIASTIRRAHDLFVKQWGHQLHFVQAALDRLIPDVTGNGIALADVVIEAAFRKCIY